MTVQRTTGFGFAVDATIARERTEPTCEVDGSIVYTATVAFEGNEYTDTKTEALPALGHDWNEPEYVWSDD